MPNSLDEVPGKKINDTCPVCTKGRLRPVTRQVVNKNEPADTEGGRREQNLLDLLACNNCSACFTPEPDIKNVDLIEIIWRKSEGFKNPERKPTICLSCGSKELKEESVCRPFHTHATTPTGEKGPEEKRFVLYCQTCYTVLWLDGLISIPSSMLGQFGA